MNEVLQRVTALLLKIFDIFTIIYKNYKHKLRDMSLMINRYQIDELLNIVLIRKGTINHLSTIYLTKFLGGLYPILLLNSLFLSNI
jgi:hypothetical protein